MSDTLGSLVWFSVTDEAEVEHLTLCQLLLSAGVTTSMPAAPKSADVFKRACNRVHREGVVIKPEGTNNDSVWRSVWINDEKMGTVFFNKENEEVTFETVNGDAIDSIVAEISAYVESHGTMLTAYAIREHIRRIVEQEFQGIRVKQGVYFVLASRHEQLELVEGVANKLNEHVSFHSVPVPDDERQRSVIHEAAVQHAFAGHARLVEQITEIIDADKKLSKERFNALSGEHAFLSSQLGEYAGMVDGYDYGPVNDEFQRVSDLLHEVIGRIRV